MAAAWSVVARGLAVVMVLSALGRVIVTHTKLTDRNGDGQIHVLCIGDSNTAGRADVPKWCELIARRHPEWRVADGGVNFARAAGNCVICGRSLLGTAIASGSLDVVLIALGTNDTLAFHAPPEVTVDALVALREQAGAANVDTFIATIPPRYETAADGVSIDQQIEQQINAVNDLLAQRIPADRLIDFHSGMEPTDFVPGGLHLNQSGQRKRAAAADRALMSE